VFNKLAWLSARSLTLPSAQRLRPPCTMPERDDAERTWIRDYAAEDGKEIRFMLAQAQMEYLAFANNRCAFFRRYNLWLRSLTGGH
jgi:hypothetical protein